MKTQEPRNEAHSLMQSDRHLAVPCDVQESDGRTPNVVTVLAGFSALSPDALRQTFARDIPDHPGYRVLRDGRVQTKWRQGATSPRFDWKDMRGMADPQGYRRVGIGTKGGRRTVQIHRLVAEAFIPNPRNLPVVRHLDNDPSNNHVDNLAWGTYADNEQDKKRHGTYYSGSRGGSFYARKLTLADAQAIRSAHDAGETGAALARRYGVGASTVYRIIRWTTYRPDQPARPSHSRAAA